MLQEQAVPEHTLGLLKKLSPELAKNGFYLAGGTALALRLGHRLSTDLDFFTEQKFEPADLLKNIESFHKSQATALQQSGGSIAFVLDETKIELLCYEYPLLEPVEEHNGITMASLSDNVAMKLSALVGRGSKKPFADIAALLQTVDQETMFSWFQQKYPNSEVFMLLKSLAWFEDAEQEPDPHFLQKQTWGEVKEAILKALR